ncbi:MAG: ABC transporter ATP-binding protein [Spirochaetales bacterium]|nr:ABC transporter ATP-binding protein [Spirochaetales bacterium]
MITIKDLSFTYRGNKEETLHDLNFTIEKGEIFGFLGPSGAGKSTTQKILFGLLKNYTGSVTVNGAEMNKIKSNFYEDVGIAFEFPNLYTKFTALENLDFFATLYSGKKEKPMDLLAMVGLEKNAKTLVSDFSKGMKMRLNFCRALLHKPSILFLDEPTAGLDPVNQRIVREIILKKKAEGVTVFITTHQMEVADYLCDRVSFLVDGEIKLIDSPRELKIKNSKKILRVEFRKNAHLEHKEFKLDGLASNKEFLNTIEKEMIETMHTQEATLEDIFIKTTGRRLS